MEGAEEKKPVPSVSTPVFQKALNESCAAEDDIAEENTTSLRAEPRRDKFGTNIEKGSKRHRVSFRDNAEGGRIDDIYVVESYKKYWAHSYGHSPKTTCKCVIF